MAGLISVTVRPDENSTGGAHCAARTLNSKEGAIASIKYATLDEDGPTGTFYAEPGLLPAEW